MRKPVLAVVAGFLAFAIVAVGCGGGTSKLSAKDFADKTCGDLGDWTKALTDVGANLSSLSDSSDADTAKKKLSSALGTLDSATAKLVSGINSRSAPNVASGDQIKKAVVDALNKMRDQIRTLRTKVDNFDAANGDSNDTDAFLSNVSDFSSGVDSDVAKFSDFSDNSALNSAFSDSKVCQQFASEASNLSS
ncbi:MAG TPA: hypothetical protein VGJ03_16840 [Acidimicrobiales bacterium]|jgi:hypothetical protein